MSKQKSVCPHVVIVLVSLTVNMFMNSTACSQEQLTGYMCLNRVETADSLCIVQPFSPCLFQQEDLTGPNLFLKFWRGKLQPPQHYEKMKKDLDTSKQPNKTWPQEMEIYCRGCSVGKPTRVHLKHFPRKSKTNMFAIIAEGMERFCNGCRRSGRVKNVAQSGKDDGTTERKRVVNENAEGRYIQCTSCPAILRHTCFSQEKLAKWEKHGDIDRRAVCPRCEEKEKPIRCTRCDTYLQPTCYDQDKLKLWRAHWHVSRDAVCLQCEKKEQPKPPKPLDCVKCGQSKDRSEFDEIMLARWTKHRELSKKAECIDCRSKRNATTRAPKQSWNRPEYTCK